MPEPFRFDARIRFIDTDASGRIHYTALFRYFESAESELFRSLGVSYLQGPFRFPRVHAECDIRLALRHDDPIEIAVCLTKLGRSSVRLEFETLKSGEIAATGAVVIVCMHRETERAMPIPDEIREKFAEILTTRPE